MTVTVLCPHCGTECAVPASALDTEGGCPVCGGRFLPRNARRPAPLPPPPPPYIAPPVPLPRPAPVRGPEPRRDWPFTPPPRRPAPPRWDVPPRSDPRRIAALDRLKGPGKALMVLGAAQIAVWVLILFTVIMIDIRDSKVGKGQGASVCVGFLTFVFVVKNLVTYRGGRAMQAGSDRTLADGGAIVALIPDVSMIFGLFVGVMSLIALRDPEVRRTAFDKRGRAF